MWNKNTGLNVNIQRRFLLKHSLGNIRYLTQDVNRDVSRQVFSAVSKI